MERDPPAGYRCWGCAIYRCQRFTEKIGINRDNSALFIKSVRSFRYQRKQKPRSEQSDGVFPFYSFPSCSNLTNHRSVIFSIKNLKRGGLALSHTYWIYFMDRIHVFHDKPGPIKVAFSYNLILITKNYGIGLNKSPCIRLTLKNKLLREEG